MQTITTIDARPNTALDDVADHIEALKRLLPQLNRRDANAAWTVLNSLNGIAYAVANNRNVEMHRKGVDVDMLR
mgnify:CR=1 FL=1